MNAHKDENWLDDELRKVIDGTPPAFDADAWRRKYAKEYEALTARRPARVIPYRWIGRLAVAAVLVLTVSVLLVLRDKPAGQPGGPAGTPPAVQSPAKMVSMISLATAYRQGGEEALNEQLDGALNRLGPRPGTVSALQILDDLEG